MRRRCTLAVRMRAGSRAAIKFEEKQIGGDVALLKGRFGRWSVIVAPVANCGLINGVRVCC